VGHPNLSARTSASKRSVGRVVSFFISPQSPRRDHPDGDPVAVSLFDIEVLVAEGGPAPRGYGFSATVTSLIVPEKRNGGV
jgi:hypothetical protein